MSLIIIETNLRRGIESQDKSNDEEDSNTDKGGLVYDEHYEEGEELNVVQDWD
ncbi:925_t:CDS:2 [Racocetra fulgida]|uniref:925_t:CDS:1 n=1 Tax=Racocetra fulgida TaxID=60492 RepID=A0A9N8WMY9_9GLOM|nr:925_t:CDS:2 [Racocetra fulgida]